MFWVIFPLIATVCYSTSTFVENFIVDHYYRGKNPASMIVFSALGSLVGLLALLPFIQFKETPILSIVGLLASGIISTLSLIPYFRAFKYEDATAITLFEQLMPVFSLIFGMIFLRQFISTSELAGFFLIIGAIIFLGLSTRDKTDCSHPCLKTFICIAAYCLIVVISDVLFVASATGQDVMLSLFIYLFGAFCASISAFIFVPKVRRDIAVLLRTQRNKKAALIAANAFSHGFGDIAYRIGMTLAPLALVTAVQSISQLIFTFLLGIVLTYVIPRFHKVELATKSIASYAIAIIITSIGLVLVG